MRRSAAALRRRDSAQSGVATISIVVNLVIKPTSTSQDVESHLREQRAALCAKLFAIFWITTVIFFELSAFKRRAYLLSLWPASAVLLSWWVIDYIVPRRGHDRLSGLSRHLPGALTWILFLHPCLRIARLR